MTVVEGTVVVRYVSQAGIAPVTFVVDAGHTFDPTGNGGKGEVVVALGPTLDGIRNDVVGIPTVTEGPAPTTPGAPPVTPPTQEPTTQIGVTGSTPSHQPE